ncbi:MAG: hypothetical protein AB1671_26090 [Thermodesulfobacteriota bacterium]|jgi:hypothetical protein
MLTRRALLKHAIAWGLGLLAAISAGTGKEVAAGYGKCSRCSCPGFYGSGSTCSRSGCGHHYDEHW